MSAKERTLLLDSLEEELNERYSSSLPTGEVYGVAKCGEWLMILARLDTYVQVDALSS